jgi:hypothetical protein
VPSEHTHCETQFAESSESVQERGTRAGRTSVRLQNMLRGQHSGDSREEGSEFELELRSTLA